MSSANIINLQDALKTAKEDPAVGIKLAHLTGDDSFALFCTSIPPGMKVGAHYHHDGQELYQVVSGTGCLYLGNPMESDVEWTDTLELSEGDCITVRPGQVHQLENTGEAPLVAIFGCPRNHITTDRTLTQSHH